MSEIEQKQGFDKVVTHRDPKTGVVVSQNPYTLRVLQGPNNGKMKLYERPVGSGNLWTPQGEVAGRWIDGKYMKDAVHVEYQAPVAQDYRDAKIVELQKELDAIKAEAEKKSAPSSKANAKT